MEVAGSPGLFDFDALDEQRAEVLDHGLSYEKHPKAKVPILSISPMFSKVRTSLNVYPKGPREI